MSNLENETLFNQPEITFLRKKAFYVRYFRIVLYNSSLLFRRDDTPAGPIQYYLDHVFGNALFPVRESSEKRNIYFFIFYRQVQMIYTAN